MVGSLLQMIASPTMNPKALEDTSEDIKSQSRRSPVQLTHKVINENKQGISAYPIHNDKIDSEYQDDVTENKESVPMSAHIVHDDHPEDDLNDNSISFQCSCKVWSCTQCNKAFNSARALKIHEVKQHENMPKRYIKCSHCEEVFDHGNLLQIHLKVHHNIKVQCPQCEDQPNAMNTKTPIQKPMCPVCGVKFDHDKLLKLHMEHYHKVSGKEAYLPSESTLSSDTHLSPNTNPGNEPPESRERSPEQRKRTPSPRFLEERFSRPLFYDNNAEESSLRRSLSPREAHRDNREADRKETLHGDQLFERSPYQQRPMMSSIQQNMLYRSLHDDAAPPYSAMNYIPEGVRRRIEKRPLGRSHSLPLKQEAVYQDMPPLPFHVNNPVQFGFPRDKKIDRAALEAVRNSLKEKLRTVEATLLRDEAESHQSLSPTLTELYEHQRYFHGREEDVARPYRPSVITPRGPFSGFTLKRKAPSSDVEPLEKMRSLEKNTDVKHDLRDSRSPIHNMSAFYLPPAAGSAADMYNKHNVPKVAKDDLSIPNIHRKYSFDDHAKIFIKRGAPRCNRCQQTFSSKMEYLHHLISHREKDGLTDASPEEIEFIEDVKRSIEAKSFSSREALEIPFRQKLSNSPGRCSPQRQNVPINNDENPAEQGPENLPDDESSSTSTPNPDVLSLGTETCTECKDVFADSASYQVHIEKRHLKPRCRECGLTFDHKNLLKIHMDCYHSTLDVLQCYYCGMSFKQRSAFLDHVTSHEAQDINNKERAVEQANEPSETGGRRRWGRLVASAQLPSEKLDLHDKEHPYREDLLRNSLSLKGHTKTKLRKTVSLSAYTDMINRQRRSASEFLHESRSKGDEAIGKEMRTRIFLPSFEDKMGNLSRFAASSAQLAKKRVSPPPKVNQPSHEDNDFLYHRRNIFQNQDGERQFHRTEERSPLSKDKSPYPVSGYHVEKRKLMRLKRRAPVDEEDIRASHLGFPPRKAFVRDEVESLYQLRHKKEFQNPEGRNSPLADTLDHRNALVKIERVEIDRHFKQASPHESERIEAKERCTSPLVYQPSDPDSDVAITTKSTKHSQSTISTPTPPPLIDTRRCAQPSTQSSAPVSTDSSPTSSNPESPIVSSKSHDDKSKNKPDVNSSSSVVETNEASKENKGKHRNSIKKLTKEALINSLSLKRRASAPDLYQYNRESTENLSVEKNIKSDSSTKPDSPKVDSEIAASPPMDTKHHGSRSLYYTPRRQSERDVTCTQCGVSFGHKKLYKIHIDSYHGKQQGHECLQCGSKDFRDKDEFVKHLMSHQNEEKADASKAKSSVDDPERNSRQYSISESTHDSESHSEPECSSTDRREEDGIVVNSSEGPEHFSSQTSNTEQSNSIVNNESLQPATLNNNSKDKKTTCFTCGKRFENGKQLEQHFSSHASISEDGRFCCVICGKAFETHRKLEIHSRSHTGFKPHKCEQCGRCFPYYSSYYYHKMTHTKDRPHKCPICGKGFIQTRYLRSHLTTHKNDSLSDEAQSIIRKAELNMNEETDEESVDSPSTAEGSPAAYRANDEEAVTAEILCSFKRGLSVQNSDSESPSFSSSSKITDL